MQLFVIVLFLALLIFARQDNGLDNLSFAQVTHWQIVAIVFTPKLVIATIYALVCRATRQGLYAPNYRHRLRRLGRLTSLYRICILALYLVDLAFGALDQLHQLIGHRIILVSELLIMIPPLLLLIAGWWAYYPIEHCLRNAELISRIDQGKPIYPIWTHSQYIAAQFRHQVALLFIPLAMLLALTQLIEHYAPRELTAWSVNPQPFLYICGAGCIFLFAPLLIRYIWKTTPLPEGELRQRLLSMCRQHQVGVCDLLIWQTFGGITNAAVMGIIRPIRYILLSDGLLELLHRPQVEAVMAHELAHVRHRHMFWLITSAGSLMLSLVVAWSVTAIIVERIFADMAPAYATANASWSESTNVTTLISIGCWIFIFGWVSRRFECQADAFAVQHMATEHVKMDSNGSCMIDAQSVDTMIETLNQVAELNHIDPDKKSWRHGSIHWRQQHLRSLVGMPSNDLTIDRTVNWIKLFSIILVIAGGAAIVLMSLNMPA